MDRGRVSYPMRRAVRELARGRSSSICSWTLAGLRARGLVEPDAAALTPAGRALHDRLPPLEAGGRRS